MRRKIHVALGREMPCCDAPAQAVWRKDHAKTNEPCPTVDAQGNIFFQSEDWSIWRTPSVSLPEQSNGTGGSDTGTNSDTPLRCRREIVDVAKQTCRTFKLRTSPVLSRAKKPTSTAPQRPRSSRDPTAAAMASSGRGVAQ